MAARHFAIIPAAGHSARMGRPKLLLPLGGRPLIRHVIEAWKQSNIDRIVVVIRPDDQALADAVQPDDRVDFVFPVAPPPDMKASIQAALKEIEERFSPADGDGFLVAPGDMPRLSPAIIDRLIQRHLAEPGQDIFVPTICGKRGHPTLFSWRLAAEVHRLAVDQGLNCIVDQHQPILVPCEDLVAAGEYPFADLDTPEEYRQMTTDKDQ